MPFQRTDQVTAELRSLGRSKPVLLSKPCWLALMFAIALVVVLSGRASPQGEAKGNEGADAQDEHIEKLLPDQKTYFRSPPSVIDLSETFLDADS